MSINKLKGKKMTDKNYPLALMEKVHGGKRIYRYNPRNIDRMLKCLGTEIAFLEDLQELGVEMKPDQDIREIVGDVENTEGWFVLAKEVKEDSEEFMELVKKGFIKVEFNKEGERT